MIATVVALTFMSLFVPFGAFTPDTHGLRCWSYLTFLLPWWNHLRGVVANPWRSKQKQNKNRTPLYKGEVETWTTLVSKKTLQALVVTDSPGRRRQWGRKPQEAGHIPHIQSWEEKPLFFPLCRQLWPEELECLHSLAGKHVGSGALAGWNTRPCWGSETSSDADLSCLPPAFPFLAGEGRVWASTGQERPGDIGQGLRYLGLSV